MSIRMISESHKPRCRERLDRRMGASHTDICNRRANHSEWHIGNRYKWDPRLSVIRGRA